MPDEISALLHDAREPGMNIDPYAIVAGGRRRRRRRAIAQVPSVRSRRPPSSSGPSPSPATDRTGPCSPRHRRSRSALPLPRRPRRRARPARLSPPPPRRSPSTWRGLSPTSRGRPFSRLRSSCSTSRLAPAPMSSSGPLVVPAPHPPRPVPRRFVTCRPRPSAFENVTTKTSRPGDCRPSGPSVGRSNAHQAASWGTTPAKVAGMRYVDARGLVHTKDGQALPSAPLPGRDLSVFVDTDADVFGTFDKEGVGVIRLSDMSANGGLPLVLPRRSPRATSPRHKCSPLSFRTPRALRRSITTRRSPTKVTRRSSRWVPAGRSSTPSTPPGPPSSATVNRSGGVSWTDATGTHTKTFAD